MNQLNFIRIMNQLLETKNMYHWKYWWPYMRIHSRLIFIYIYIYLNIRFTRTVLNSSLLFGLLPSKPVHNKCYIVTRLYQQIIKTQFWKLSPPRVRKLVYRATNSFSLFCSWREISCAPENVSLQNLLEIIHLSRKTEKNN